jgi:hypothetical protein
MRGSRVLEATLRLRASLDIVAGALSSPDLTRLVAAESDLAESLADISAIHLVEPFDRQALATEVIRARAVLHRCRTLGAMITDVTRMALAAQGQTESYGRSGNSESAVAMRGRDFNTRI